MKYLEIMPEEEVFWPGVAFFLPLFFAPMVALLIS